MPDHRLVDGVWMTREEYDVCGWHIVRTYETVGGTVHYWRATLEGLRRYGQLVAQRRSDRIAAAITRREADDEFSEHVESILDAKPEYPR
jgi:hypothetical protein